RVLLIDADLRRSAIPTYLGTGRQDAPGLADAAIDPDIGLEQVVQTFESLDFSVVPVGSLRTSVQKVLASPRLVELIHQAREQYGCVILDTPPLVPVCDSSVLARSVDGVLVVIAANKTPRKLLEEALNLIDPPTVLGLVYNGDTRPLFGDYGNYYRQWRTER